jgi:hypothetical protein
MIMTHGFGFQMTSDTADDGLLNYYYQEKYTITSWKVVDLIAFRTDWRVVDSGRIRSPLVKSIDTANQHGECQVSAW